MARILIIDGHPSSDRNHYVHALASAYREGAEIANEVRRIDIAKLDFPLLRDPEDWNQNNLPADLGSAQDKIAWADHVVLLYPIWLGDVPAALKAFLEQVARPGFALEERENGTFKKLLKGKSAHVIVTMGMPAPIYRIVFRAHSVKSLKRNILQFVGFNPVRTTLIGHVGRSADYRKKWLQKVEKLGRRGR
ncbi:MAG: NAD(P)H-dependent oxidoreductase [Pseudomonadota bacterium]